MVYFKSSLLALLALPIFGVLAAEAEVPPVSAHLEIPSMQPFVANQLQVDTDATPPVLKADIEAIFPDADIFGVKLVNGRPTKAVVEFTNHEDAPIQVAMVGGLLSTTQELAEDAHPSDAIVRNLTAARYDLTVEAGDKKAVPYSFALDMQPQDVLLQLVAVVTNSKGDVFQVQAYNATAAIVEPPTSIFDPQMYVETQTVQQLPWHDLC